MESIGEVERLCRESQDRSFMQREDDRLVPRGGWTTGLVLALLVLGFLLEIRMFW